MEIATNKFHFIGIGGIGMSGLAEILNGLGAQVTGSDLKESTQTSYLRDLGVKVYIGHKASCVEDSEADVVVYSSAISKDNPEYQYAIKNKIPLIRRAEALAELMRLRKGVAVAGTHGKTTTTSLIAAATLETEVDPTIIVGGVVKQMNSNAKWGKGRWLVAEADESDGSFDKLSPEVAVITNIDNDHLDHFGDFETLSRAYLNFAEKVPFYGRLIYCGDDRDLGQLFKNFPKPSLSYGFYEGLDYTLSSSGDDIYHIKKGDEDIGEFRCPMPGDHNALNALAALIVATECLGVGFQDAVRGLEQFKGVGRRFQIAEKVKNNIVCIDDYAHHPTEVGQVLKAAKSRYAGRRIMAVFQPHRYTRLQTCWEQFLNCFDLADEVFLTDIYPAGESPIEDISSENLAADMYHPSAYYLPGDLSKVAKDLKGRLQEGDVVLVMGAGSINHLTNYLCDDE